MAHPPLPPIPLEVAQSRLLALVEPLRVEHVDLEGALGRYLAQPLLARRTQPAADVSAMDGYAVASIPADPRWTVIGESAAGHPHTGTIGDGEAVRISTGALLPAGASAVVLQEDIAREGDAIHLEGSAPAPVSRHVRHCGMDFAEGTQVLPAGIAIGPAQIALAMTAGHKHLPVHRRPTVTIIDSGDELARDPEVCPLHQVPASNGLMLAAMMRGLTAETRRIGPVVDTMDALIGAFDAAGDAEVIVTSGGASVGDHDLVRPALEAWGAQLDFWRIAIKPGKPLLVATRRRANGRPQVIVGLPGNPASSMVTAFHFVLPLLRRLLGAAQPMATAITTRLGADVPATGARREFLRAHWDGESVSPVVLQDSGALAAMAASNALIDRPAHTPALAAGEPVSIYQLQNG
ncbi:molybdopterin molybdotransferase MoeA [Novosphingobium sp. YJ-S2-02]|uniref:Molybdopterin molybdenumtransferase n=1 Tax=Novosphingobium aureum TaxID=2792964 RepID=A0A931MLJ4_9SPHN|nr:molybdopterin molybdotransferase MoeA [Novosphingobium aureum]MBH0113470.1 molybdopterin molybdotransferase MoeA [Novosphingobium aureum]